MSLWTYFFYVLPFIPQIPMYFVIVRRVVRNRAKVSPLNRQKIQQVKKDIKTIRKSRNVKYGHQETIEDVLSYMQSRSYFFDGHYDSREERIYYFSAPTLSGGKYIVIRVYWNTKYLTLGEVYGTVEDGDRFNAVGITEYS